MSDLSAMPPLLVELDGKPLAQADAETLGEVVVMQQLSAPTLCELRYFDPSGELGDGASPRVGTALRVSIGRELLFTGEVTALDYLYEPERGREVRVRGFDRLHRLRLRQPVRAHPQVSLTDIADELVRGDGITVRAHCGSPAWPKVVQFRHSDLDLLTQACERASAYFILRDDVLHITGLDGFGSPRRLRLGSSLHDARVSLCAESVCAAVSTEGWDPWTARVHQARATPASSGRRVPTTGALAATEWRLVGEPVQDAEQAQALAQTELDHRVASEMVFTGTAEGDPALGPGTVVDVEGVAGPLAGRYVIASATHRISAQTGYVCELSSEPPPLSRRPWGATMAIGTVTRVDDPDGLGRVRAVLPAHGDLETDWLAVSAPGAGPERGLIALPDRGDTVLIFFAREDPAQGIVIGGLFGSRKPPDGGVDGNAVERHTWQSADGHRISLDVANGSLSLEIADGSSLTLSPDKVALVANADLEISAAGRSVVIEGDTIDFRKA